MKTRNLLFGFICIWFSLKAYTQSGFQFSEANRNRHQVSFQVINNLVVIPLEINGKKLSFILDSGVNKTILFNLTKNDSIALLDTKKIMLRGLGDGEPVAALISKNNRLSIKNIESKNETIYVILKDFFDLSSKMGTTIHGIIGYNLLKNFVVKINYKTKKIDFYNPKTFTYGSCKKCETFPVQFFRKKPFINVKVQLDTIGNTTTDVKMLVDLGGSDAMWLFENSKKDIKTPILFFNDILGEGLSGTIFGNRSRIPKIILGKYEIDNPTVSFLDSVSTHNARKFKARNGSIGGEILKRFIIWINYSHKKITLKKNGSFTSGFNYNMSGLEVVYSGNQLVKEEVSQKKITEYHQELDDRNSISFVTKYAFQFKPSYKIQSVIKNSPADKAGLLKDDEIVKINHRPAHEFSINDIVSRFQERDNKKIKLVIRRNGVKMKFQFRLHKRI
ncbi:aspartyl protease family protein [Polaribacter sp.]|uniref:aspartyl protease family protein n=1 Tax=Polaribacter sp. TaxID=1920175 RepID=UPI003EF238CB